MSGRYVKVADDRVALELTPDEWAVALDALLKTHNERNNDYTPWNKAALGRTVAKMKDAASQLRRAG